MSKIKLKLIINAFFFFGLLFQHFYMFEQRDHLQVVQIVYQHKHALHLF